jgi:hypothetical protein
LFCYSDEAKLVEICNKLALLALKLSCVEQCVEILMAEGKLSSPQKKKVIWRTLASVLMQEKDLSSKLAAVVSSILIYNINSVHGCQLSE